MTVMQRVYWFITSIGNISALLLLSQTSSWLSLLFLLFTVSYSLIGYYDLNYSKHNLNKLYPVVAYLRYFLESYRVEIQQYFIANDTEERPFNRERRTLVYQRSKNIRDTVTFGTQRDLLDENYLTLWH